MQQLLPLLMSYLMIIQNPTTTTSSSSSHPGREFPYSPRVSPFPSPLSFKP
jgi:hypothetical protein